MNSLIATLLVLIGSLTWAAAASAASVHIGRYSEQSGPSRASAGASVEVSAQKPGAPGHSEAPAAPAVASSPSEAESSSAAGAVILTSESSGPSSVTKSNGAANTCEVRWVPPCAVPPEAPAVPARPAAGTKQPAVNPATLATAAAGRIPLVAGSIQASPSAKADGLTGAASWFWLSPSPAARSVTVSAGGEHVTVSAAVSEVRWSFGDGSTVAGGAGVPYQSGAVPASAVRHVYQVRCLPGDAGRDPNVLPSCGPDGYTVAASVVWAISYHATGPVSSGGVLPSRTTTSSLVYPVSEVRAFLTSSSGGEE